MIAAWMLYSLATSLLLFAGAAASDYVARASNRSTRMLWLGAMLVAITLAARALSTGMRPPSSAVAALSVTRASTFTSTTQPLAVAHTSPRTTEPAPSFSGRLLSALDALESDHLAALDRPLAVLALGSTAAALTYLWLCFVRLRRIERRLEWRDLDGQTVLVSRTLGPALLGVVAPRIVVPEWVQDLPTADRRVILAHEQRHAAARDPLLSLASTILVALQPWNPLLWMMRTRLRRAIETDCDRRVLDATRDVRAYAELLIAVHERTMSQMGLMVAFVERPSNLEWRVREMTRRPVSGLTPRGMLTTVAAASLIIAACTTPEPTGTKSSPIPSAATLSSITGGGRCMSAHADVRQRFDELRALASKRHPDIVAANDSTDVIGFVLDENCNVRRDTTATLAAAPKDGDAMVHAVFPEIKRDGTWKGGMTFLYGSRVAGRRRWGPTVVFLIQPSESWRARRASDLCGFGARSDEFCSVTGSVAIRRVDSTRLIIAVRSKPVRDSSAGPLDHYFLVSALRPLPDSLTRRIRFGRVMYQNNAVYVENRVTTEPAIVFGSQFGPAFADLRMPRVIYDSLVGIAHYASPGVTLENIDELRPAHECDGPIGSCYEVDGKKIEFPG